MYKEVCMSLKIKVNRDYNCIGEYLYTKSEVILEPGISVLVGCNGSGKSTLIRQIKDYCEHNKIFCLEYDNLMDGGGRARDAAAFHGDMELLGTLMTSSEGESIYTNVGTFVNKFGRLLRKISQNNLNDYEKEFQNDKIFIVLDAVDSGLSIDIVVELKDFLNTLIIPDCQRFGITPYIVISTNAYEFAHEEDCIDIQHMEHMKFESYEQYKEFIMSTAEFKNNREKVLKTKKGRRNISNED